MLEVAPCLECLLRQVLGGSLHSGRSDMVDEGYNLRSATQASLTVTEGSTVGLTVDVVAETDSEHGGRCAEPTVMDPFN